MQKYSQVRKAWIVRCFRRQLRLLPQLHLCLCMCVCVGVLLQWSCSITNTHTHTHTRNTRRVTSASRVASVSVFFCVDFFCLLNSFVFIRVLRYRRSVCVCVVVDKYFHSSHMYVKHLKVVFLGFCFCLLVYVSLRGGGWRFLDAVDGKQ